MTLLQTLAERFKGFGVFRSLQGEEGMSDVDLRETLDNALRATEPGYLGIEAVFMDTSLVVFAVAPEDVISWFSQEYTIADSGEVTFGAREEVAPVTRFEPVAASAGSGDTACPCDNAEGDTQMDERIKALIANKNTPYTEADFEALKGFPEERLAALEEAAKDEAPPADGSVETPATPPVTPPVEGEDDGDDGEEEEDEDKGKETPTEAKAPTWDDMLKSAPSHLRRRFDEIDAAEKAEKADLVSKLDEAQEAYSKEDLEGKDIPELRQLAKLALKEVPAPIDFGARGVSIPAEGSPKTAPKPPSLTEAVQAKRKEAAAR